MKINITKKDTACFISLVGNFDRPDAKDMLINALNENKGCLVALDLIELDFAGSYFASTLLQIYRTMNIDIKLINIKPDIRRLLDITGVSSVMKVEDLCSKELPENLPS